MGGAGGGKWMEGRNQLCLNWVAALVKPMGQGGRGKAETVAQRGKEGKGVRLRPRASRTEEGVGGRGRERQRQRRQETETRVTPCITQPPNKEEGLELLGINLFN